MARLEHRMRRLTKQAQEIQAARQQAQLARMSDEELTARLIKATLVLGIPEELAQAGSDAVLAWWSIYERKMRETMPEEEWDRISGRGSIRGD